MQFYPFTVSLAHGNKWEKIYGGDQFLLEMLWETCILTVVSGPGGGNKVH